MAGKERIFYVSEVNNERLKSIKNKSELINKLLDEHFIKESEDSDKLS